MSRENVEIVREAYAAFNRGDFEVAASRVHSDVVWIPDSRVGEGPVRGRENVIRFFTDRAEMFGDLRNEPERLWDRGDQVLVFVRVIGSGAASGTPFEIRIAHLWTLRDGMLVRGEGFGDRDQALEAAGLRE